MKIFTLKANENWILDRMFSDWKRKCEHIHTDDLNEADIIWILPPWQWKRVPPYFLVNKLVVVSIHHIVPEKFNAREFNERDRFVDHYHVPCEQTKNFIKNHTDKQISVMGYWYDAEFWQPLNKEESRKELDIPNDQFVVGSFQRDTEGSDLTSPKLEKGPDLFIEYVKKLDKENLCILLGGWRRQYVINELNKENISYIYKEMAPLETIRKMYAACDLYVVSSRYEGGPQAVMEAPSMNVPIVSSDVGMASKVLPDTCIIDVENETYIPTDEDVATCSERVTKFDLNTHVKNYEEMFSNLIEKG